MKPIATYWASQSTKPEIFLSWDINDYPVWYAKLDVKDHPVLGAGVIRTSAIVNFNPATGIIETRNTVYVPIL